MPAAEDAPDAGGNAGPGPEEAADGLAPEEGQDGGQQRELLVADRALIKTGTIELRDDDVDSVTDEVTGMVLARGGEIAAENTSTDRGGKPQQTVLELRIPVAEFDQTVTDIADLATLVDKTTSTKDVTSQVTDVDSRVESARESLQSLRRLFARATSLGQVISLETQVAEREADLESLLAQQQVLADQTSMSTVRVTVTQPPNDKEDPPAADDKQEGFLSGISQGWDAFTGFVVGFGHAVGVALPLGSLFALLGLIGWVVVRRRLPHPQRQTVTPTD